MGLMKGCVLSKNLLRYDFVVFVWDFLISGIELRAIRIREDRMSLRDRSLKMCWKEFLSSLPAIELEKTSELFSGFCIFEIRSDHLAVESLMVS
jgi:hypothetical protein